MTKPHFLTINWNGENPLAQILPQPPLLSSSNAGWDKIQLDYLYQPAHESANGRSLFPPLLQASEGICVTQVVWHPKPLKESQL